MFTLDRITDPQVRTRLQIEYLIARQVVEDCIAAGYAIVVQNGEPEESEPFTTSEEALAYMFDTDQDDLILERPVGNYQRLWIRLQYGEPDSTSIIWDYSVLLEALLQPALRLAEDPVGSLLKDKERLDKLQAHPTDYDLGVPCWELGARETGRTLLEGPDIRVAIDKEWN